MRLFVYGTLKPGEPNWHHIEKYVDRHSPAVALRLDLFDYGPFPVAVRGERQCEGVLLTTLRLRKVDRLLAITDEIEAAGHLYQMRPILVVQDGGNFIDNVFTYVATPGWAASLDGLPSITTWSSHNKEMTHEYSTCN